MKNKICSILFISILFIFAFMGVSAAATTVKEKTSNYEGEVYIIGSTRFENTVITAEKAAMAGVNEARLYQSLMKNLKNLNLKLYLYDADFDEWYVVTESDTKQLTEKEIADAGLDKDLEIFFVNNEEKTLEFNYEADKTKVEIDEYSAKEGVKYDGKKFTVPATVLNFSFTENGATVNVDTKIDEKLSSEEGLAFDYGEFNISKTYAVNFILKDDEDNHVESEYYIEAGNTFVYTHNEELPIAEAKDGYEFLGWFEKDSEVAFTTSTVINKNYTLYPRYLARYTVTFSVDGDVTRTETVLENETVPANAFENEPSKEWYEFKGWFVGDSNEKVDSNTKITANTDLVAKFEKNKTTKEHADKLTELNAVKQEDYTTTSWNEAKEAIQAALAMPEEYDQDAVTKIAALEQATANLVSTVRNVTTLDELIEALNADNEVVTKVNVTASITLTDEVIALLDATTKNINVAETGSLKISVTTEAELNTALAKEYATEIEIATEITVKTTKIRTALYETTKKISKSAEGKLIVVTTSADLLNKALTHDYVDVISVTLDITLKAKDHQEIIDAYLAARSKDTNNTKFAFASGKGVIRGVTSANEILSELKQEYYKGINATEEIFLDNMDDASVKAAVDALEANSKLETPKTVSGKISKTVSGVAELEAALKTPYITRIYVTNGEIVLTDELETLSKGKTIIKTETGKIIKEVATAAELKTYANKSNVHKIKLTDSVTLTSAISLIGEKEFDLGGNTVTANDFDAFSVNTNFSYSSNVTFKNGKFVTTGKGAAVSITSRYSTNAVVTIAPDVEITSEVYGIGIFNKSTVEFYGKINVTGNGYGISGNAGNPGSTINVYEGSNISAPNGAAFYIPQDGTLNIKGGTLSGASVVLLKSGVVNVTGGTLTATGEKVELPAKSNNGKPATGDVIAIEVNKSYAGGKTDKNIQLNITGGTLTSQNAYVVREVNVDNSEITTQVTGNYSAKQDITPAEVNAKVYVYNAN